MDTGHKHPPKPRLLGSRPRQKDDRTRAPAQATTTRRKHPPKGRPAHASDVENHDNWTQAPPKPRPLDTSTNHNDGHWTQPPAKTTTTEHKHPPRGNYWAQASAKTATPGHKHPPKEGLQAPTTKTLDTSTRLNIDDWTHATSTPQADD